MHEPEEVNIPAFQRKRSIVAKEKKLEQKSLNLLEKSSPSRKKRKLKTLKRKKIIEDVLTDIPMQENNPDEKLLELLETPKKRESEVGEMKICGTCDGYFDKINVTVIKLTSSLRVDDEIFMETSDGLFRQTVTSMQIDRKQVTVAKSGDDIGIKVFIKPKIGGSVYKTI